MKKQLIVSIALTILFFTTNKSFSEVLVNTGGKSNGASLAGEAGPKGINQTVTLRKSGGSIKQAKARGLFSKTNVNLGNQVVSRGTKGDPKLTHVDANSIFAGTGTFMSDDGNPVENFTIGLDVHGILKCKSNAMSTFFSIAQTGVELIIDDDSKFSGTATQDGTGPFFDSGDLKGQFQMGANIAMITKQFPINLGTLEDGQKLPFLFIGTTLVSYGEMVGIKFCSADFLKTSSFEPLAGQKGALDLKAGKQVIVIYIDSDTSIVSGNEKLLIESQDSNLISNIKPGSIKVIFPTNVTYDANTGTPGDLNSNGLTDSELTVGGSSTTLATTISTRGINTLVVYGQTTTGETFYGLLDVSKLK